MSNGGGGYNAREKWRQAADHMSRRFGRSEGTEEEALLQLQAALGYFALSNGKQQFSLSI